MTHITQNYTTFISSENFFSLVSINIKQKIAFLAFVSLCIQNRAKTQPNTAA